MNQRGTDDIDGRSAGQDERHDRSRLQNRVLRLDDDGAFFLLLESANQPTNVTWLAELEPSGESDDTQAMLTVAELREHIAARLDLLSPMRWRLYQVPFGLQHPVIAKDPDFDITFHVEGITLGEPGNPADLDELMSHLAEMRLDQGHPLWKILLVDGLPEGRQALVVVLHHAMWDGTAGRTVLAHLFGEPPDASLVSPEPLRRLSVMQMLTDAFRDQFLASLRFVGVVWSTMRGLRSIQARSKLSAVAVPRPNIDTPVCSLNNAYGAERRYAKTVLSVAEVRRVKDAAGVTFNHVVMALVATSLRNVLAARGDLPDRPLVANVPVSSDPSGAPQRQWGNGFGNMMTSLATDVDDPWERLHKIAAVALEARLQLELMGVGTLSRWSEFAWPVIARPVVHFLARSKRTHKERAECNVLISNIAGGDLTLALGSFRVSTLWLSGPPLDGVGVIVCVYSSGDQLAITAVTHASAVDDPRELVDGFGNALAELASIADGLNP